MPFSQKRAAHNPAETEQLHSTGGSDDVCIACRDHPAQLHDKGHQGAGEDMSQGLQLDLAAGAVEEGLLQGLQLVCSDAQRQLHAGVCEVLLTLTLSLVLFHQVVH